MSLKDDRDDGEFKSALKFVFGSALESTFEHLNHHLKGSISEAIDSLAVAHTDNTHTHSRIAEHKNSQQERPEASVAAFTFRVRAQWTTDR